MGLVCCPVEMLPPSIVKCDVGPWLHATKLLSRQFDQMSCSESPKMEVRRHSENKKLRTSEEDIQARPQDLNKIHIPKPPKDRQKPALKACVRKTQLAVEVRDAVHPVNLDPYSQLLDYPGSQGLRLDDQGMVLSHSILGSLEDFRSYLEAKGETELVKRIPKSSRHDPSEAPETHHSAAVENSHGHSSGHRNVQCNALQHWHTHMTQRRQQQNFLSDMLDRPVENLLMNQANHFRETQEKREFLNQVMPLIHSGYGYRVGSEFWSLPNRYGDEMSGIIATLTQAEQGRQEPVTHVAQPSSIRQESGLISAKTLRPASRTWDQSAYLQRQCQELGEVLQDMDMKKPEINELEVIGSSKPFPYVSVCRGSLLEKEEEEEEHENMRKENLEPQAHSDDIRSDALLIPALRFCGQLARWTGNSTANQGEVGLSATLFFEALTGESASSHLELHNEGSTAIFYSWERLPVPHSFPLLRSQTKSLHFYFNSSSGVSRPGDIQRIEVLFKSEEPGIETELWQLNTHPVLLQGASMQVTLRGVALYQDNTVDQRLFIERKLEEIVKVKLCLSIVDEVLWGVRTPERPSSPAELYVTEEQEFLSKNTELQYLHQPVEDLKRLWQEVHPESTLDFSVRTLRQVVLSLREQEPVQENSLAQLNSLLLQLSEPCQLNHRQLTSAAIMEQLWRKLLDTMAAEAMRLRNMLGLPERDTWIDNKEEPPISEADVADDKESENKGGATATDENGTRSRIKDESQSALTEKSVESVHDSKKKGRRLDEVRKRTREKQFKGTTSLSDVSSDSISQQHPSVDLEGIITGFLHKEVYVLMEDLVYNLCDLMDELHEGDEQDTRNTTT
ncbi:MYCBP-associated protein isoform X2 [Clinocottus analis]|uniref:MYCBP-associated protein isoform X2 n=1 Tax=Clinocottus analis TaxID=304258 RepID=UPI0035BFD1C5